MIGRGIDYPGHRQRQNQPHFCCLLLLRLKGAALGIGIVLCLDAILLCGGQKPINLGGVKRRDVYIAGFFPYGRHVPESHIGRGVMPSVKLAVDHINDNPAVLRNYRLHMWWNDTECNAAVGVKAFFDMMHSGPHKVMLFGAACTQVTDPIAKASKHWRLTQLSYADTHPMFTSDNFPNFFRIVPSENAFNAPRVALLNHFNWTRVGTIYQNEPRYALAHNRLVADLDDNKLEVVETQSFATEVSTALEKLKHADVRIILGNFNEVWARRIFCEAHKFHMFGSKFQWIIMGTFGEEWWLKPDGGCAPSELAEALHGAILTDLLPLSTDRQITVSGITPDEYQVEYDSRRGNEYSRFHGYTYDGIWAVALAIQHVARRIRHFRRNQTVADFKYRDPLWEKLFLEALRNTSFEGVTGPVRFYDNERKAYILLKQFQSGSEVKVGEYDGVTDTLDLHRGQRMVWHGKSPPKDRTVHVIEHSTVNISIYVTIASAASVGILLAVVFLAINIRYRNQRYIKMSSPHLNNLIIVGCMLTYSSVIFLGLDSTLSSVQAFPYICTARAWLLMAGFSLAFGAMFSKTWRVHSIFTDVKLNKKVIKDYQLFMVVGVLLVIDLAIMTTWQVADPFYRETKQMEPYPHPSSDDIVMIPENEYCQSNRMTIYLGCIYAYKGLLMIFGAFLAWETRHVSIPALNDSKYVGMSVYNVVIMCVTGAAISFVLADKQDTMFIMLSIFIIFCSTATLCLVFVPKLIELRRNPQGAIDKRIRATLRPSSKTRRDSSVSELEERLKDVTTANQKFRKQLLEKESELQMYLRRLGDESLLQDTKEAIDRLSVPRNETLIKREGVSMVTETTDVSMSLCSLNSTTVSQPESEYVNVIASSDQSTTRKHASFGKTTIENERTSLLPQATSSPTTNHYKKSSNNNNNISNNNNKNNNNNNINNTENQETEPLLIKRSPEPRIITTNVGDKTTPALTVTTSTSTSTSTSAASASAAIKKVAEFTEDSLVPQETELSRDEIVTGKKTKDTSVEKRAKLPTPPPPTKNVSFGELREDNYLEQAILPPPVQFVPKHRHSPHHHQTLTKRRSSVKNNGLAHSHHELFEKRRTSVPANTISYISTENISKVDALNDESLSSFDRTYVIGECGHRRAALGGGTGYRCEKHGGGARLLHTHHISNGSTDISGTTARVLSKHHRDRDNLQYCKNASSPSVPAMLNASYSDTEKTEDSSAIIQRSVSEKSREKCSRSRTSTAGTSSTLTASSGHHLTAGAVTECRHRTQSRKHRECRHTESRLRQQARLEYVQSSPNVATTVQAGKFASANPRGGGGLSPSSGRGGLHCGHGNGLGGIGSTGGISSASAIGGSELTVGRDDKNSNPPIAGGSTADLTNMCSAVSDGELLDVDILPIFQKLLSERHKNSTGAYGSNIASCPNISIKCDIVEYL
ncbi:gamma-aminobutyric acid type B receptor subunit 2 isoform X2 [Microplitis mediator]|uniref:gamma-aminobutyric acid type B receptor subunit 2 isoform X2 n=1 Tax=Microplitis mediator TaxID=375433 RepID=UPI0025575222|nr:gamma-aminobutyric acid type B receptor subunit 2 isoform X2 [Microplitis mediator]